MRRVHLLLKGTRRTMPQDRDELFRRLASIIGQDLTLQPEGWAHLVLVVEMQDDGPAMSGYAYPAEGKATPVAPSDFTVFDVLEELQAAMASVDGRDRWRCALVRVDRSSGQMTGEFEYEDAGRWAITPTNGQARAEQLDPR